MDIEKIVTEVVGKLTGNQSLIDAFLKDPAKILKDKLGIDVPADKINAVVTAVKAKRGIKDATGLLAKLKSLFGKK